MANIFAITTATQNVKSDDNGNAIIVFIATNTTNRPLRGMAKVKVAGNTRQTWLKIEGEKEHDFPAGSTQQFTVTFSKPLTNPPVAQPAEQFPFAFNLYDASNPNENFTEGPSVTVETPEIKVPDPIKFPWWMVAVAAVLVVLIGGTVWFLLNRNKTVEVPSVVTMTFPDAKKLLEDKGFKVDPPVEAIAPDKPLNIVFAQEPKEGEKVPIGTTLKLSLPAMTKVPPLKDKTFEQAFQALNLAGLEIDPNKVSGVTSLLVVSSAPGQDQPIAKGAKVGLGFQCPPSFPQCYKFVPFENIRNRIDSLESRFPK